MNEVRQKIREMLIATKKVDIHEHLWTQQAIVETGAGLGTLSSMSYIGPFDFFPGLKSPQYKEELANLPTTSEKIVEYVRNFPNKSAVECFLKPFTSIYRDNLLELDASCLLTLDQEIWKNYTNKEYYNRTFKKYNITNVLYDTYQAELGSNVSDIFSSHESKNTKHHGLLRINSLLYGFDPSCWNPQTNLMAFYCTHVRKIPFPANFGDYLLTIDQLLEWASEHYVGIKCASAYERPIDFGNDAILGDETQIYENFYSKPIRELGEKDILQFGNYIFHYIISKLATLGLPLQIHTGTAIQPGSRAKNLSEIISTYSDLTIDLLHFGYPWTDDVLNLIKEHENAYTDFVWLPQLDHKQIPKIISQIGKNDLWTKVMAFGGDCACIEGSIGALEVLLDQFSIGFENLVDNGKMNLGDVEQKIHSMFYETPKLFFLI